MAKSKSKFSSEGTTVKRASDVQITRSLQETVRENPNIKEVYFNEEGGHYFNKHTIDLHEIDGNNVSQGTTKVECLPGAVKGLVKVGRKVNGRVELKDALANVEYEPIAATMSREEVLSADAVSDILTEKQKLEILTRASEIAKGQDFQGLLDKINAPK